MPNQINENQKSIIKPNAGFLIRGSAYLLDISILVITFLTIIYFLSKNTSDSLLFVVYAIFLFPFAIVFRTINKVYLLSKIGGSLGKRLFGLKTLRNNMYLSLKGAFLRTEIGYNFSYNFLGLGFLRTLKNPENLTWHDELFETKVIKEGFALPGIFILIITLGLNSYLGYEIYKNVSQMSGFYDLETNFNPKTEPTSTYKEKPYFNPDQSSNDESNTKILKL